MCTSWARVFAWLMLLFVGCTGEPPYVPPHGASVGHYELSLQVYPDELSIEGTVRFDLTHPPTLEHVALRAGDLGIASVQVAGEPAYYRHDSGELSIDLLRDTLSTIEIAFSGSPTTGLYSNNYDGSRVIYTDSWPYRGEHWWPALHHPSVPATWTLTLHHPPGPVPVATGERTALDTLDDRVSSTWSLRAPAPTYSMAFALGSFNRLDGGTINGTDLHHYVLDEVTDIPQGLRRTPSIIATGNDAIGPYPYSSYSSVQIPFQWAGMENAGKGYLHADRYTDPAALEEVMAHEAFHQWFGNRLPIANWRDLWISEGITTYLTTLFFERSDGERKAAEARIKMAELSPSDLSEHHVLVPDEVRDPWDHLNWVPYRQGGSVVHLLRLKLGDERFFHSLRSFYAEGAGSPQSTEDFKLALEADGGVVLDDIFDVWVYAAELPRLRHGWDPASQLVEWEVTNDKNVLDEVPWEIQICQQTQCDLVDGRAGSFKLDATDRPSLRPVGIMLQVD